MKIENFVLTKEQIAEAEAMHDEAVKEWNDWVKPHLSDTMLRAKLLGWRVEETTCSFFAIGYAGLRVMVSGGVEKDGRRWIHLSASREGRMPNWGDMKKAKEVFLGDVNAIQVLPKAEFYINDNPHVLHLWHCLENGVIPDFRKQLPNGHYTI